MKKTLMNIIVIIYVIIAIFTTICLLTFNHYKVSEFGDKTLVIIDKEDSSYDYKEGDLIIVGKKGYEKAESRRYTIFLQ